MNCSKSLRNKMFRRRPAFLLRNATDDWLGSPFGLPAGGTTRFALLSGVGRDGADGTHHGLYGLCTLFCLTWVMLVSASQTVQAAHITAIAPGSAPQPANLFSAAVETDPVASGMERDFWSFTLPAPLAASEILTSPPETGLPLMTFDPENGVLLAEQKGPEDVPLPPSVWLLGSGLVALLSIARGRKTRPPTSGGISRYLLQGLLFRCQYDHRDRAKHR
jgi:hypothetical protein